ncbi:MAG: type I methionyl aminopeptidase [Lachnospiraceae bacterium]|nr:type I methionyl aminopeptidase [Lachnospiraceae bacterium]
MGIGRRLGLQLGRNEPCWCGSGKKYKSCHLSFDERIDRIRDQGHVVPSHELLKTREQIEGIKESAKRNIAILDYVASRIGPGISTQEIDDWVVMKTKEFGAVAATLGYEDFPKSVCTSINNQVCHGIPDSEDILEEGDIINVDCSTIYNGYVSDSSRMFLIGEVEPEVKQFVEDVHEAVNVGLREIKPWRFLGDMGSAINAFCRSKGYSVVEEIGGHGCGVEFHEEPWVSYVSKPGEEMLMVPGLCFTVEPMVNMGARHIFEDEDNGWTIYTEDGSLSAQWEVQIVVTDEGYELLTW